MVTYLQIYYGQEVVLMWLYHFSVTSLDLKRSANCQSASITSIPSRSCRLGGTSWYRSRKLAFWQFEILPTSFQAKRFIKSEILILTVPYMSHSNSREKHGYVALIWHYKLNFDEKTPVSASFLFSPSKEQSWQSSTPPLKRRFRKTPATMASSTSAETLLMDLELVVNAVQHYGPNVLRGFGWLESCRHQKCTC